MKHINYMKRMNRLLLMTLPLVLSLPLQAQIKNSPSGLNSREFSKYWKIESESPDFRKIFSGDTLELMAPKGITLWRTEKMDGSVTIEYDACIVKKTATDRLSDLNCFWMASDPLAPNDIMKRSQWRSGIFNRCYSLQTYYLGYGGNNNTTTRFRKYDGDYVSFEKNQKRPSVLKEYTDAEHLLKANHWYHVKIHNEGNRVLYYIDGELLVDFRDANPLSMGWFGFRTTESHVRITGFHYSSVNPDFQTVPLHWIGNVPSADTPSTWGVPFEKGLVKANTDFSLFTDKNAEVPMEHWKLASWPDGSVKWMGVSANIPQNTSSLKLKVGLVSKGKNKQKGNAQISIEETETQLLVNTGVMKAYLSKQGQHLFDSLRFQGHTIAGAASLVCNTTTDSYTSELTKVSIERSGRIATVVKVEGFHGNASRKWLPFTVRLYFSAGSEHIKLIHSLVFDGDQDKDFIKGLGIVFDVPLREELYNRHIAFSNEEGGVWSEPVQPLVGRRILMKDKNRDFQAMQMRGEKVPDKSEFDEYNQGLLHNWASWNDYRLSQLSPRAFSIRKRTHDDRPWIGTIEGNQSDGAAFLGDVSGGLSVCLEDFWESYPTTLEVTDACKKTAHLTVWLWSPESEPMDLRHYDHVAHDLNASYEDVQPGMSTPYGIGRTHVLQLKAESGYKGKENFEKTALNLASSPQILPAPEYLHQVRAFGVWSLPDSSNSFRADIENKLNQYIDYYKTSVKQNGWYGFWNYGDFMHAYDPIRHEWRYDIGGFAWDNTELGTDMWLWYSFLRSGRSDIWTLAKAMARHTCEVDVYHIGEYAGLGSRHNVSHWGCGAKEARISQAAWNRFLYYLTADERSGDLMTEVKDADQKLYKLDPMRLAQPRDKYPCTAPARLRIGPDWLAYAGNWMTEWERTGNTKYRDKIIAGMKSIVALPHRIFTGPTALGYDPATGIITSECDTTLQSTNHLMTIMGGFEIMNEMLEMIQLPEWQSAWTDHAARYMEMAKKISHNGFRIPRLTAYGAYMKSDARLAKQAWMEFQSTWIRPETQVIQKPEVLEPYVENKTMSTNDAATWGLDAIYLMEVLPDAGMLGPEAQTDKQSVH